MNQRKVGAILSYASLAVNAIVSFIYVPILLGALTATEYGIYELIGSIIAYLSIMDMGLSTTLSRFYVSTSMTEEKPRLENLLATAAVIYGVLTALAVLIGLGIYALIDPLFGMNFTAGELDLARQMMVLVILNCVIVLPGNWFLAIINAEERFIFARTLSTVKYILQVVAVISVLFFQQSALAVLVVQVLVNAVAVFVYAAYVKFNLRVRSKLHKWDWRLVRSLFSFSFFILLNMVFDQIFWKTGQVVLGAVVGATAVAVYGIACKLITAAYMQFSTALSSVFLPKLTTLSARTSDMNEIDALFKKIGRLQAVLIWGVCAAFAALGEEFIYLWAGPEFSDAYLATLVLMVGLCISLIQNLGITLLQAKNKMGFRSIVYIALAILDIVISIPVSAEYGVLGCAFVTSILLFIGTGPIMNLYYHRIIGLDIPGFFRRVTPLIVPVSLAGILLITFSQLVIPIFSWGGFIVKLIFFVFVYFGLLWILGFNDYEKNLARSIFQKLSRKRNSDA